MGQFTLRPVEIQVQLECLRHRRALRLLAENTIKSYKHDWKLFSAWCGRTGHASFPASPETVLSYLTDVLLTGRKVVSAARYAVGIRHRHLAEGLPSPVTDLVWAYLADAQRVLHEQPRRVDALTLEQIRRISGILASDATPISLRDRAIVVVGFASALRRSNLVDLLISDVNFCEKGAVIHVRHEKQDQEGRGRYIGLPYGGHPDTCPVLCLRAWLAQRAPGEGPVFTRFTRLKQGSRPLKPYAVARIVKACVARIGLDPSRYAGHSLRAGLVTEAGNAGAGELLIAAQTGHRSMDVLRSYFRRTDLFKTNVCTMIGL